MRKAITTLVLALTGALFGIGSAGAPNEATAAPIAHERFEYLAGPLPGDNGGSGFIGAWAGDVGVVVQPGLGLQHPLALTSAGSMIGGGFDANRNLSATITQSIFWASFLIRFDPGNDQVWLGFDVIATALPVISFGRRLDAYFIQNGSSAPATLPGASPPGVTDLLIARITRGGASTTVDLWVNKLPGGVPDLTHVFGGVAAPSVVNTQVQPGIFSDEIRIGTTAADVAAATVDVTPSRAKLDFGIVSVRPSPTNGATVLELAAPRAGTARLEIFNAAGRRARTLVDGDVDAGITPVRWDGLGENGRRLSPGAYFAMFRMGDRLATRKIVLLQ